MRWTHAIGRVPLLFLLAVAPAWAAEAAEAGGQDEGAQLLATDWGTILTAIVTFLVLLFVLTKLAWKPILAGLKQREDTIRKAVDDAERASEEARTLVAEYQAKLDHARAEAQAIAEEAKRDAEVARRRMDEESRAQAEETLTRALKDIERARQAAFDELLGSVTAIAAEAASRIVRREISPERNADLVEQVVEEYARSRGERPA